MSTSTTLPAGTETVTQPAKKRSRTLPPLFLLLLLAVVSLAIPAVFQFLVKHGLSFEMWRRGGSVVIQRVEGSLWEPLVLIKSRWHYPTVRGGDFRLEADRIEVETALSESLRRADGRWLEHMKVKGAIAKLRLAALDQKPERPAEEDGESIWHFPGSLDVRDLELVVSAGNDFVRFTGTNFSLSNTEPGTLEVAQFIVRQPWLSRTFRDVRATTALQGGKVLIADAVLEKEFVIRTIEADPAKLPEGVLDTKLLVEAFGGRINAQVLTLPRDRNATIEASGNFTKVGIAPLATFLSISDAAGGTINDGHFRFRGSPRNLMRASASLRVDATNFQWESRQWDSLILGATLMDRRVQIPELELHQGQNRLSLNGEMELPAARKAWWQSDFNFNIAAKIENLTELSALVLPEFRFVAGRMNIDGAVRGRDQQFNGALIVSGSNITWRNAPIEELHAALKVTGNELQVANFEVLNGDDFVRGRGVVNILGAKQYWGELRASIEELGTYAALLQRPIVPEPLAGGGTITWSGEGSAAGHSGKFSARLRELRTLGATGALIHPLRADLEGVYSPGAMHFSHFALSDEASAFIANVAVTDRTVTLQDLKLTHGDKVWLKGDAVLPLDLWRAWPETAMGTLLADNVPGKINLEARDLQLREASRLTGWKWPIEGVVNGTIKAEGVLGSLQTSGEITLRNGRIPLGWSGDPLSGVSSDFQLSGQSLAIRDFVGTHDTGTYRASGTIDFTNIRDTTLDLSLQGDRVAFDAFGGISLPIAAARPAAGPIGIAATLDTKIQGPASKARISGKVAITEVTVPGGLDTAVLWRKEPIGTLPHLFSFQAKPFQSWPLDLAFQAERATGFAESGTVQGALQVKGTASSPSLAGTLNLTGGRIVSSQQPLEVQQASLTFRDAAPGDPSIELRVRAAAFGGEVSAVATGPLTRPLVTFDAIPPLSPALAELVITDSLPRPAMTSSSGFQMIAPPEIGGDAPIYPWSPIAAPVQPAPAPAPGESASPEAATNPIP